MVVVVSICQSRETLDLCSGLGGFDSFFSGCTVQCESNSLFRTVCEDIAGVVPLQFPFLSWVVSSDLSSQPRRHQMAWTLGLQSVSGACWQKLYFSEFGSWSAGLWGFYCRRILVAKLWSACEASSKRHKGAPLVFGHFLFGQHDQASEFVSALKWKDAWQVCSFQDVVIGHHLVLPLDV